MQSPSIHLPRIRRRFPRVIVASVAAALLGLTGLLLPGVAKAATQICSNQTGTESGYYYSLWENGTGSACLTYNGSAYSTSWSSIGDFTAGVGWNPGNTNTVNFTSSVSDSGGTALVSVYGWMTNPLVDLIGIGLDAEHRHAGLAADDEAQKEIGGFVCRGVRLGLSSVFGGVHHLASGCDFVTLRLVVEVHVGAHLEEAGRVPLDGIGISVDVGKTTAAVDLRAKRVLRDDDRLFGALRIEPCEHDVRILACRQIKRLLKREGVHFGAGKAGKQKQGNDDSRHEYPHASLNRRAGAASVPDFGVAVM